MQSALILLVIVAVAGVLIHPKLAKAPLWLATITPLASIIGSGFLVLGPILEDSYGYLAPAVMLALCGGAYLFGAAIRANMITIEREAGRRPRIEARLETLSAWSLAFAYIISVAYYLNLFGAFGVSLTPVADTFHARLLSSAIFVLILLIGWTRGFSGLEKLEQVSVGIKLAIIGGLLFGLTHYFARTAAAGDLAAVADTSGSGGLIEELTRGRITTRQAYAVLVTAGLVLTWTTNVFQIISYASRAFALYYALQAAIATVGAWRNRDAKRMTIFAAVTILAALIVVFGHSVE